jgi:multidrug resistance protein, MATE family
MEAVMAWDGARAEIAGIVSLSVPIVVGLGASTLLGVTDSIMLAPLGPLPLAAVGLTLAVAIILYAAIYGMLQTISVRVGAAHGAGDGRAIPLILRNGLALSALVGVGGALVMGLLWFALPLLGQPPEVLAEMPGYWLAMSALLVPFSVLLVFKSAFEAIGRPWLGTGFAFVAVVVNVPLNYALIWGAGPLPALGLVGAGIGSLLAESVALAVAWVWWVRAPSLRRTRLRRPLLGAEMASVAREGAPLGALYVAETGAMAVATVIIGTFGAVALAGNQVAQSVGALLYMVPLGIAGAVSIRVAQAAGAGQAARLRGVAFAGLVLAVVWLSASAALLGFGGRMLAASITDDPAVIGVAVTIFAVFATMQIADGVQSTMLGALRGMSDTGWPAMVSIIAYWGAGLPLGWVLSGWFGPAGVWAGFAVALFGAGAALSWRFLRKTGLRQPPSSL